MPCQILVTGSGNFAERFIFDLALRTVQPTSVVIAGRSVERARLEWLRTAGNARAALSETPFFAETEIIDWNDLNGLSQVLRKHDPELVVHAASIQSPDVYFSRETAWNRLMGACTLTLSVPYQARLGERLGKALRMAQSRARLINCCYPDGTNPILVASGLPVVCGLGNVAILAGAFAGELGLREAGRVKVLAHHQTIMPWRGPEPTVDVLKPARVWVDDVEIPNVVERFKRVRLPMEPALPISGYAGVSIVQALLGQRDVQSHVPGPKGLFGGYPVRIENRELSLDPPKGLSEAEAIQWNRDFELAKGIIVENGRAVFQGYIQEQLERLKSPLAHGFSVDDIESAAQDLDELRVRLQG